MVRTGAILTCLLLLPLGVMGATLRADDSLRIAEPIEGNAYLAGAEVEIASPLPADALIAGTLVRVLAQITGDALVAGGTVSIEAPIAGDARIVAGQLEVSHPVAGELAALARHIRIEQKTGEIRVIGGTVEVLGGADGPVSVYGNDVILAGDFTDSVRVVAANSITLAESVHIAGSLNYNAPQEALIPESAEIAGGVSYVGSASFLPTAEEAQVFALAGFGIYVVVRIVAGMLMVGLFVGLFGAFTRTVAREVVGAPIRKGVSLFMIGFLILVGVPLLLIFLAMSVVGIGLAFLIGAAYVFALLIAYILGAAVFGALLSKWLLKRTVVSWQDAIVGFLVLSLFNLIPGVGFLLGTVVLATALGALGAVVYRSVFVHE